MTTTFSPSCTGGSLNGSSEVTLVAAPGAGVRLVKMISVCNVDTAAVVFTLYVAVGATRYTLWSGTLSVGDTFQLTDGDMVSLPATYSIVGKLAGAAATTNPTFYASWGDQA